MIGWLILASLIVAFYGVRFRIWWLVAVAAVLALPINLAHIAFFLSWLFTCVEIAMAVALRWRVGVVGWCALLLVALGVVLVGGPGTILLDWHLSWILLAGPLVGFVALAWQQPPWVPAGRRSER